MILTLITLSLTAAALSLSIYAAVVARRTSARSLLKQLSALSMRVDSLEDDAANLERLTRNLQVRANMATMRARQKATAPEEPEERSGNGSAPMSESEKDEWQRRMNRELALKRMTR